MKHLIFSLLSILFLSANLFAAAWTGSNSEPTKKIVSDTAWYVITTPDELAWFASQVNSGNTAINAVLANDIVFGADTASYSSSTWTMIGNSNNQFAGVFDGRNHTVYGIHLGNKSEIGFFGYIDTAGIVKNLILNSNDLTTLHISGNMSRGGIAAVNKGVIENCINKSGIHIYTQGASGTSYIGYAGGIVAKNYGTILNSKNYGSISVGDLTWPGTAYAGGIAAYNEGLILKCLNGARVESHVARMNYVGGIAAKNTVVGKIKQSFNTAFVCSSYEKTYTRYGPGANNGGIVGLNSGLIENAYNVGRDSSYQNTGASYTGGIVGYNSGAEAIVRNSYAASTKAYARGSSSYAGGVAGRNESSAQIINSDYDSDKLSGISSIGSNSATATNVSGKSTAAMQSDRFAWILNTTNGTEENSGVWSRDSGYPVFANSSHLAICRVIIRIGSHSDTLYTNSQGKIADESYQNIIGQDSLGNWISMNAAITRDMTISVHYEISFLNYDSSELQKDTILYGALPGFSGEVSRDSTAQYAYTFKGWSPTIDTVESPAVYVAQYDSTVRSYEITFVNFDGTVLQKDTLLYGELPSFQGEVFRDSTAQYAYTFKGWNPTIDTVESPAVYVAQYDSTVRSYEITFVNFDGTVLQKDTLLYGELPSFQGEVSRDSTAQYAYTFKGWNPTIDTVKSFAVYVAQYDSTVLHYEITFVNFDGETLQSGILDYGDSVVYKGTVPEKAKSAKYAYTFKGWMPEVAKTVRGTAMYTAVFDSTRIYSVTIDDGSGKTDTVASILFVLPEAPEKDGYEFVGWYDGDEKLGMPGDTITVTKDISISAKWEKSDALHFGALPHFNLHVQNRIVQIQNAPVGANFNLLDLQGRVLRRGVVNAPAFSLEMPYAGTYIVRVGKQSDRVRVK